MSYYYLSEKLGSVFGLSTEKKYFVSYSCVFNQSFELANTIIEKIDGVNNIDDWRINEIRSVCKRPTPHEKLRLMHMLIERDLLVPEWKRETEKLQQKISVSEFSELKKETNILKRISDLEDECVNLIDCEYLTMRLKKERENNREEIEKLHQRISILEEENKQLKENFKTNVLDIIKQYVYSLFFFRK